MEVEKCSCKIEFPLVLQYQLQENAIVCSNCNLNRDLVLSDNLRERVRDWNENYNGIYKKWLETDTEIDELTNASSNLNQQGIEIVKELNIKERAYYWLHVEEGKKFLNCPNCKGELVTVENVYSRSHKVCNNCNILMTDNC